MSGGASAKLRALLGADARALAVFRIGLGASLLVDLATRAADLTAHYSDAGMLPRSLLMPFARLTLPLHRLTGSSAAEGALFAVAALAAAALLLGFHTRWATVVSYVLLQSLHERNRLILDGGDPLLRIMVFWAMFVPLDARWSWSSLLGNRRAVDAPEQGERALDPPLRSSVGIAALLVQIASMYLFTGLLKVEFKVWQEGTALRYALLADHMTTPLGAALLPHPWLMSALSRSVLVFEMFGPLLWFSPWRTGVVRTFATFGFLCLQLGIASCMTIGNFQPSAIVFMLPFLPAWFWDELLPRLGIRFAQEREESAESAEAPSVLPQELTSWQRARERLALVLGLYLWICNVGSLFVRRELPGRPERLAYFLGIDQRWDMFAGPRRATGWTVIPATLESGEEIDLLTGKRVTWDKPRVPADIYGSWRWRRYITWFVWTPRGDPYRAAYASYLCRTWNQAHPEGQRLIALEMVWMRQSSGRDFTLGAPERLSVYKGACPREAR